MLYVLVSGKRDFNKFEELQKTLDDILKENRDEVTIVHGEARGTDAMAGRYAAFRQFENKCFRAQWFRYGKAAGPMRNQQMVDFVKEQKKKVAVFFWDGKSPGTGDCLKKCRAENIRCITHYVKGKRQGGKQ